ncbi:MAG: OmpA family protein [Pirellulales bacterium]|nr:OmpA family protein [Pirellulales bacterium]
MSCLGRYLGWPVLLMVCCIGCGRFVFTPNQATAKLSPEQQQTVVAQSQQWQERADQLDRDNQALQALLAQSRQQIQLLSDEIQATRGQLKTTTDQLAEARTTNQSLKQRTEALAASVQRRTGAEIRPNNSLVRDLVIANIPGITVRPDGDVIRIEVAADRLFQPASARPISTARNLLQSIANELNRQYPRQIIGIEGHTDPSFVRTSQYGSSHHLTIAQAMVIYDMLTRELGMSADQLFVMGQGSNHPVVSNATPAGQTRNRRIELVVYPETFRRQ